MMACRCNERFDKVEQTLTTLTEHVKEEFTGIQEPFQQVDQRFDSLEARVQRLQVLEEQNATQIGTIAEIQAHQGTVLEEHGAALQRIEKAIEPLTALHAAVQSLLPDHERRIRALEKSRSPRIP